MTRKDKLNAAKSMLWPLLMVVGSLVSGNIYFIALVMLYLAIACGLLSWLNDEFALAGKKIEAIEEAARVRQEAHDRYITEIVAITTDLVAQSDRETAEETMEKVRQAYNAWRREVEG